MFRVANKPVPKAKPQTGQLFPSGIPTKGIDARSAFSAMDPQSAVMLNNVISESYGLRTRKGYTEWANTIPGSGGVNSVLNYIPATATPTLYGIDNERTIPLINRMMISLPSALMGTLGKLFAVRAGFFYEVGAGGVGPWTAEVGVGGIAHSSYWNGINFQNTAGSFYLTCDEHGGYAYYNGAAWTTPTIGTGAGQISGVDPKTFAYVTSFKKRLWFVQEGTTTAWYLPVEQLVGAATRFDFGTQFDHGGKLVLLVSWTVDGGNGPEDRLVAFGSQGDVVIYSGSDPDDATNFNLVGTWYVGPLPAGRRQVNVSGSDIMILSQMGCTPMSKLLESTSMGAQYTKHATYMIDPLVARLMRDYSEHNGWSIVDLPKEELVLIRLPTEAGSVFGGSFLCYKTTTNSWQFLSALPYTSMVNVDALAYAGTLDGRVVRAFDGPLDNVLLGKTVGDGIVCQVVPAYSDMKSPGMSKTVPMVRPFFLGTAIPSVKVTVLTNYSGPRQTSLPTIPPAGEGAKWNEGIWNLSRWAGMLKPLHVWFGCVGSGHIVTCQLDYVAGGDTLLTNIDYWLLPGGPM